MLRILIATTTLLLGGLPAAHAQVRSWMQSPRTPAAQVRALPTAAGMRPTTAPTAPPQAQAVVPAGYPLPAAPPPSYGGVIPATAYLTPPSGASAYAAPYLTAQQPTLAPPLAPTWNEAIPPGNYTPAPSLPAPPATVPPAAALPPLPSSMPSSSLPPAYGPNPVAPPMNSAQMLGSSSDLNDPASMLDPGMSYEDPGEAWAVDPGCGPWFCSVSALVMTRDAPNNVELAYLQPVPQISVLNSEQAGMNQWRGGVETRFGRAIGDRWAIEGVYFFLDTYQDSINIHSDGNQINSRLDFENIFFQGAPLSTVFDDSREQRFLRENIFENIEINLIQQALVTDPSDVFAMTSFLGVRYFRFDELIHLEAVAAGFEFADVTDTSPEYSDYRVRMRNRMTGMQLGSRISCNLWRCLRLYAVPRVGLFANSISQFQHVCRVLNTQSDKVDAAMLGQLDLGLSWQIHRCVSLVGGYRVLGIAGVATADDNIARTFTSPPAIDAINSSGSLILHGWTLGVQAQF